MKISHSSRDHQQACSDNPGKEIDFESFIEKFQGVIYVYDLRLGKTIWTNGKYCEYSGYHDADSETGNPEFRYDLFHPDDMVFIKERVNHFRHHPGESFSGIFRLKHRSGRWICMYCCICVLEENDTGQPLKLLGFSVNLDKHIQSRHISPNFEPVKSEGRRKLLELTRRELQVLQHISKGKTCREIAFEMNLSAYTIDTYRKKLSKKLDVHSMSAMTRFALENGLR